MVFIVFFEKFSFQEAFSKILESRKDKLKKPEPSIGIYIPVRYCQIARLMSALRFIDTWKRRDRLGYLTAQSLPVSPVRVWGGFSDGPCLANQEALVINVSTPLAITVHQPLNGCVLVRQREKGEGREAKRKPVAQTSPRTSFESDQRRRKGTRREQSITLNQAQEN